ncbi:phosphopantetheine-binding protein [Saccharothrix sp. BKS2]|uniref:phosphopantetheine-binding protein n=1 Tax=Saccharothrix sp. BKS2 TaxID=3064400 RepID=UPI0039E96337
MHSASSTAARRGDGEEGASKQVAEFYGRVLGIDDVGPDDDFFVLGGTSLSAMALLDAIEEELGVRLPVRVLYRASAVSELAREVDTRLTELRRGA